ncbi:hypothetical protein HYH03_016437 [Edaphochlamys debaryana]|uniref:Uncharacterized protein n=1 Tax=Edaphochlamys debaryana TaxID=47281 RepID=A0A835XJW0_9CHLO|nr:hypothetical protein HYH03_016437 [Edaphochlamys debaryana]|eukprot:KAG2484784.1 hypothetical protein HYH03_016437 [Edaphochlamys debaryana]
MDPLLQPNWAANQAALERGRKDKQAAQAAAKGAQPGKAKGEQLLEQLAGRKSSTTGNQYALPSHLNKQLTATRRAPVGPALLPRAGDAEPRKDSGTSAARAAPHDGAPERSDGSSQGDGPEHAPGSGVLRAPERALLESPSVDEPRSGSKRKLAAAHARHGSVQTRFAGDGEAASQGQSGGGKEGHDSFTRRSSSVHAWTEPAGPESAGHAPAFGKRSHVGGDSGSGPSSRQASRANSRQISSRKRGGADGAESVYEDDDVTGPDSDDSGPLGAAALSVLEPPRRPSQAQAHAGPGSGPASLGPHVSRSPTLDRGDRGSGSGFGHGTGNSVMRLNSYGSDHAASGSYDTGAAGPYSGGGSPKTSQSGSAAHPFPGRQPPVRVGSHLGPNRGAVVSPLPRQSNQQYPGGGTGGLGSGTTSMRNSRGEASAASSVVVPARVLERIVAQYPHASPQMVQQLCQAVLSKYAAAEEEEDEEQMSLAGGSGYEDVQQIPVAGEYDAFGPLDERDEEDDAVDELAPPAYRSAGGGAPQRQPSGTAAAGGGGVYGIRHPRNFSHDGQPLRTQLSACTLPPPSKPTPSFSPAPGASASQASSSYSQVPLQGQAQDLTSILQQQQQSASVAGARGPNGGGFGGASGPPRSFASVSSPSDVYLSVSRPAAAAAGPYGMSYTQSVDVTHARQVHTGAMPDLLEEDPGPTSLPGATDDQVPRLGLGTLTGGGGAPALLGSPQPGSPATWGGASTASPYGSPRPPLPPSAAAAASAPSPPAAMSPQRVPPTAAAAASSSPTRVVLPGTRGPRPSRLVSDSQMTRPTLRPGGGPPAAGGAGVYSRTTAAGANPVRRSSVDGLFIPAVGPSRAGTWSVASGTSPMLRLSIPVLGSGATNAPAAPAGPDGNSARPSVPGGGGGRTSAWSSSGGAAAAGDGGLGPARMGLGGPAAGSTGGLGAGGTFGADAPAAGSGAGGVGGGGGSGGGVGGPGAGGGGAGGGGYSSVRGSGSGSGSGVDPASEEQRKAKSQALLAKARERMQMLQASGEPLWE